MTALPLSVVMPTFNEEGNIRAAIAEVVRDVFSIVPGAELVVVNDGSRDQTGLILDEMARSEPRLRIIHQLNAGHGAALRHGMREARGKYLLLLDSDCEVSLIAFAEAWSRRDEVGAVFGVRAQRDDAWVRHMVSGGLRMLIQSLFGMTIGDANCPFKLIRQSDWVGGEPWIDDKVLTPSVFLAIYTYGIHQGRVFQPVVKHHRRRAGQSMFTLFRIAKFSGLTAFQLIQFRLRMSRWQKPRSS